MARAKNKSKRKDFKIEFTPRSAFLWSLFLLFLLFWVFVLGVFVGKGLIPGMMPEIKNPFRIFQEMFGAKEEYNYQKPEDPELVFYEKLVSKKNKVKNNSLPPEKKDIPVQKVTLSKDDATEIPEKKKTIEDKALPEVISGELYSVQIASISDSANAKKLVKELVDKDFDAYYYTATVKGKKTYRIMSGRFSSENDALKHLKRLEKLTGFKGFVSRVEK